MAILWLVPAALFGLALAALPIAIHLLVRQQSRRVDFPSLRFLRQSQLAAFRRRTIQDALLLTCRVAIITATVAALAGPVFQTAARSASQAQRVARAVVLEPGAPIADGGDASRGAFVSQAFVRQDLADAVADGQRWLSEQPPAARELVFVGAFRRGQITPHLLQGVAVATGIRFVSTPSVRAPRELLVPVLTVRDGGFAIETRQLRLDDDATSVTDGAVSRVSDDMVRIVAAPADQPLADAALRAALGAGIRWSNPSTRVLVVWTGADESAVQRVQGGAAVIRMERPAPVAAAASAVADAVSRVASASLEAFEPVHVSDEDLRSWSRPPGAPPADARPVDEGDRRWFWLLALALLALEHWLRRASVRQREAVEPPVEARVA
ncbi:MAG: BatA domain-containing protein [Vicinamibacterales bacterium]|jgi:hypothetical protein